MVYKKCNFSSKHERNCFKMAVKHYKADDDETNIEDLFGRRITVYIKEYEVFN